MIITAKEINKQTACIFYRFNNLIFHGGPGSTLEMRVFSERSLMNELEKSGFKNVAIYGQPFLEYGINWGVDWSLPIAARL